MPLGSAGDGATPIAYDEAEALIPSWVETRGEVNDLEQRNVTDAISGLPSRLTADVVLESSWLRGLHRAMFHQVWRWAGKWRVAETNIGIDPREIQIAVHQLSGDARVWMVHDEPEPAPIRMHHRLTVIHPFSNGNGRHARVVADLLVSSMSLPVFQWGAGTAGETVAQTRRRYLDALREADSTGDLAALIAFANS